MVEEELMSNIPNNEKNDIENSNINFNNNTPTFNIDNNKDINNNIIFRSNEENDLYSDINIINNLNARFKEEEMKKLSNNENKIFQKESENIEANIEEENDKENLSDNNVNKRIGCIKNINFINNNKEKELKNEDINNNNLNEVSKEQKLENKKNEVNPQDKQTLHYGILGILGLFCLKSLFSSDNLLSADSFLNVVILGIISFIIYKTQFQ